MMRRISILLFLSIALYSCKEDPKKVAEAQEAIIMEENKKKAEAEFEVKKAEAKVQLNSVMSKLMQTPDVAAFTSALVTAELTDTLLKGEGPYTVFAPISSAFDLLKNEESSILTTADRRSELVALLQSHIVSGKMDSVALVKNIREGNGSFAMKTLSGETLTALKSGMDIVIKDSQGVRAVVGKSDITGSNGVIHVLDKVLAVKKVENTPK